MPKPIGNSEDADRREVAERLKTAIAATGKTRSWIAAELGLSNSGIYAILGGQPGWPDARGKLCAWLCVNELGFPLPDQRPPTAEVLPEPELEVKFIPATLLPEVAPVVTPPVEEDVETLTPTEVATALAAPPVDPWTLPAPEIFLPPHADLVAAALAASRLAAELSTMHSTAAQLADLRRRGSELETEFAAAKRRWEIANWDLSRAQWPMPTPVKAI